MLVEQLEVGDGVWVPAGLDHCHGEQARFGWRFPPQLRRRVVVLTRVQTPKQLNCRQLVYALLTLSAGDHPSQVA